MATAALQEENMTLASMIEDGSEVGRKYYQKRNAEFMAMVLKKLNLTEIEFTDSDMLNTDMVVIEDRNVMTGTIKYRLYGYFKLQD